MTEGAKFYGRKGVTANAISPGLVKTDLLKIYGEKNVLPYLAETPSGRLQEPEEVARAIAFLLTNSSVNGHNLVIDGGRARR